MDARRCIFCQHLSKDQKAVKQLVSNAKSLVSLKYFSINIVVPPPVV